MSPPCNLTNGVVGRTTRVDLDEYSPPYTREMKRRGYIDRSAGMSGRPAIPSFQGGRVL